MTSAMSFHTLLVPRGTRSAPRDRAEGAAGSAPITPTLGRNHARPLSCLLKGPLLAGAALESPPPPFRQRLGQVGALSGLSADAQRKRPNQPQQSGRRPGVRSALPPVEPVPPSEIPGVSQ